jgi:septal ring factor EnvC (AmiA/AmiB activator)
MNRISAMIATALVMGCWTATPQASAQAPAPSAAEAKLREMLKTTTQRVTTAEAEAAALKAEKVTTDAKLKEQDEKLAAMGKRLEALDAELKESKETAKAKESELTAALAAKATDLANHQKSLDKWQAAHAEISAIAKKKEAERAHSAATSAAFERRVAELRTKNNELYKTGCDILDRYRDHSLGRAIAAREPFIGNTRTKMETLLQEYGDKLLDATADAKPDAAKPAEKKAEPKS